MLHTSEVQRLRYELGYNVLQVGAEPYIGVTQMFEQVVQQYTTAGATTTSTTAVVASESPAPATLTLASATGFAAGDRVVVDVDELAEVATIRALSGSTIVVLLHFAHTGTYPISVEGGEGIIRELLAELRRWMGNGGYIRTLAQTNGLKKVDEIEFDGNMTLSRRRELDAMRMSLRDELASVIGCPNMWRERGQSGGTIARY